VGLEFECDELEVEPEFCWKNVAARPVDSRCVPKFSAAKTSVMGGRRLLVCVAGTWWICEVLERFDG